VQVGAATFVFDDHPTTKPLAGSSTASTPHKAALRSEHAYIGSFVSIALSLVSWLVPRGRTGDRQGQSDRWGIFIGHWAPTFMALGVALKLDEKN
jgi:hypothetical protein